MDILLPPEKSFRVDDLEMDASETSKVYISVSDHVISKTRSELVSNGELKLSVLNEIHATWKRKMIQAGVISETIETSGSKPVTAHAPPLQSQNPNPLPGYAESGIDSDAKEREMFIENEHEGFYIPQKDGSADGYGDDHADIKPNIYALPPTNEDDEELNEDDDLEDEEGGGLDDDDIQGLIVCQFDYVKKKKQRKSNYWECKLKAGVMHINGKQILFSEAKGNVDF
ncbi:unnamed protein product [Eruca vesicaria subsp. sativa]|uniref:Uncharacterized protein n=1 Tax=Eruca vesicaria subsp. sativa TaxID=29727 RepID=A0ABC8J011_ERUVS|nr:unnamed protein product [Eruca vesicaria subsp. sativa]